MDFPPAYSAEMQENSIMERVIKQKRQNEGIEFDGMVLPKVWIMDSGNYRGAV